ncbi:MAG: PAS domain-containing protein [Chthoniobacterales bacterium]
MKIPDNLPQPLISVRMSLFAITALVVILTADNLLPYVTITPPLSLLIIGFLALKVRPKILFAWVLLYSSASIVMIYQDRINWTPNSYEVRFATRLLGIIAGNSVALGLSIYRARLEDSYLQILSIFQKIPSPLIVSDNIGNVVTVNEEAVRLCELDAEKMVGDSYFKYFGIGRSKGESIRKYLELVQNPSNDTQRLDIWLDGKKIYLQGSLVILPIASLGGEKWILTTLFPDDGVSSLSNQSGTP